MHSVYMYAIVQNMNTDSMLQAFIPGWYTHTHTPTPTHTYTHTYTHAHTPIHTSMHIHKRIYRSIPFARTLVPTSSPYSSIHDRKIAVLALCAVMTCQVRPPCIVKLAGQILPRIACLLKALVKAYQGGGRGRGVGQMREVDVVRWRGDCRR